MGAILYLKKEQLNLVGVGGQIKEDGDFFYDVVLGEVCFYLTGYIGCSRKLDD